MSNGPIDHFSDDEGSALGCALLTAALIGFLSLGVIIFLCLR